MSHNHHKLGKMPNKGFRLTSYTMYSISLLKL